MQTTDGPLSCSECGFLCSTANDTGTFVDRLISEKKNIGVNRNPTYHYIRKAYPLWQQLYHQLSLHQHVQIGSQCQNIFDRVYSENSFHKCYIDVPCVLEVYDLPEKGESEGRLPGQQLRNLSLEIDNPNLEFYKDPEETVLLSQNENKCITNSVLHGAINYILAVSDCNSDKCSHVSKSDSPTTYIKSNIDSDPYRILTQLRKKQNFRSKTLFKIAKKYKLLKSVYWLDIGVRRSTSKRKVTFPSINLKLIYLKQNRLPARRKELIFCNKLMPIATLKKSGNKSSRFHDMDNLGSWPTLSGVATTNFSRTLNPRNVPSTRSGCDWASIVKQKNFEVSPENKILHKKIEGTSGLQLKASLAVTKTRRVPEKNSNFLNNRFGSSQNVREDIKNYDRDVKASERYSYPANKSSFVMKQAFKCDNASKDLRNQISQEFFSPAISEDFRPKDCFDNISTNKDVSSIKNTTYISSNVEKINEKQTNITVEAKTNTLCDTSLVTPDCPHINKNYSVDENIKSSTNKDIFENDKQYNIKYIDSAKAILLQKPETAHEVYKTFCSEVSCKPAYRNSKVINIYHPQNINTSTKIQFKNRKDEIKISPEKIHTKNWKDSRMSMEINKGLDQIATTVNKEKKLDKRNITSDFDKLPHEINSSLNKECDNRSSNDFDHKMTIKVQEDKNHNLISVSKHCRGESRDDCTKELIEKFGDAKKISNTEAVFRNYHTHQSITALLTEKCVNINAEIIQENSGVSKKLLHLSARNILNTKTELSILAGNKQIKKNFQTQLMKVKSREDQKQHYVDKVECSERKEFDEPILHVYDNLLPDLKEVDKTEKERTVSVDQNNAENVIIICKISNEITESKVNPLEKSNIETCKIDEIESESNILTNHNLVAENHCDILKTKLENSQITVKSAKNENTNINNCTKNSELVFKQKLNHVGLILHDETAERLKDDRENLNADRSSSKEQRVSGTCVGNFDVDDRFSNVHKYNVKCGEHKASSDLESVSRKISVHFTNYKSQIKPLRTKVKYDTVATFLPVANWKRKPHTNPCLSKYRWIAPRKDSQLSPRTSLNKFQANKIPSSPKHHSFAGRIQSQSIDCRKISKNLDTVVEKKHSVSSQRNGTFCNTGRGRGSLIKSATFTNSNLDIVDRSYVMSDGMKVVFGPNAVNTPCSKIEKNKKYFSAESNLKEKCSEDPAIVKGESKTFKVLDGQSSAKEVGTENDSFLGEGIIQDMKQKQPMKPPSRLSTVNSDIYRKTISQESAQNMCGRTLLHYSPYYQRNNAWKNSGMGFNTIGVLQNENDRILNRNFLDRELPQANNVFFSQSRNCDITCKPTLDHNSKTKWFPVYDDNCAIETAIGLKMQEEVQSKLKYSHNTVPFFGSETSYNTFSMVQVQQIPPPPLTGNTPAVSQINYCQNNSFCPNMKHDPRNLQSFRDLPRLNQTAFSHLGASSDKLIGIDMIYRSQMNSMVGATSWTEYAPIENHLPNHSNKQNTSDSAYKLENTQTFQPVFFIPRKETDTRSQYGDNLNFCTNSMYFSGGPTHYVGSFEDQEK